MKHQLLWIPRSFPKTIWHFFFIMLPYVHR